MMNPVLSRRSFVVRGAGALAFGIGSALGLSGCVVHDPEARAAAGGGELRIVATTPALTKVCAELDLDLVGVPKSDNVPARYKGVPTTGAPMSPDMEVLASMSPDIVLSPTTLENDLAPKYANAGIVGEFVNVSSVDGLFDSIKTLGEQLDRVDEAQKLLDDHEQFMEDFRQKVAGREHPQVLVLMGVPGSYIIATDQSYVGSLVVLAGGQNVYGEASEEFINANTEDMFLRDPDIILRAAHGVPEMVVEMFAEEFSTDDIWKHFRAVQEGRVYDLPFDMFGMSATLGYTECLSYLMPLLYGGE